MGDNESSAKSQEPWSYVPNLESFLQELYIRQTGLSVEPTSAQFSALSARVAANSAVVPPVSVTSNKVSVAIAAETANRVTADNALSNLISVLSVALSNEISDRKSAVNVVSNALSNEISNRVSADNVLSAAINVVSNAASNATSIANAVSAKADTLSNQISVLSQQISVLSNQVSVLSNAVSVLSQAVSVLSNRLSVAIAGPAFAAVAASAQSVAFNTLVKVMMDTKEFDTNSNYDAVTNFRFTPTIAGKYFITASIGMIMEALKYLVVSIFKNGVEFQRFQFFITTASNAIGGVTTTIDMNGTTDYVEMFMYHENAVNKNILNSTLYTRWSGALVAKP